MWVLIDFPCVLKKNREIMRPQIQLSHPSQKKTAQRDVTAENCTEIRSKKCSKFLNKPLQQLRQEFLEKFFNFI